MKVTTQVSVLTMLTTTKTAFGIVKMMVVLVIPIARRIHRQRKMLELDHAYRIALMVNVTSTMVAVARVNVMKVKLATIKINVFPKRLVRIPAILQGPYVVKFVGKIVDHAAKEKCAKKGLA